MTLNYKNRIGKLETRNRGAMAGGVVFRLSAGGYSYRGRIYADLSDIPGGGVLIIPETLAPLQWDVRALAVDKAQQELFNRA
jgi:hypothetical protein